MSALVQEILVAGLVAASAIYLTIRYFRSRKKAGCPNCAVFKATIKQRVPH